MVDASDELTRRLADLRAAFDRSFTTPARTEDGETEAVLSIAAGTGHFALRIAELAHVEPRRKIVPLPNGPRGLIGVAGIRGRVVPVYGLADLLDCRDGREDQWVALAGRDEELIAFSFTALEGHARIARSELDRTMGDGCSANARLIRIEGAPRVLLALANLTTAMKRRAREGGSKE
jgi:chemotaxis signal transduction protein